LAISFALPSFAQQKDTADSETQQRLIRQYKEKATKFDVVIVGSGVGGGVLADDLAERLSKNKRLKNCRILVLEAGSFLYPTHVYNFCRFPNLNVARKFNCDTFSQQGDDEDEFFIGEKPQLNFGGRSIFWSGLIPTLQEWELGFFPDAVKRDLAPKDPKDPKDRLLHEAGVKMNQSKSMGRVAEKIVERLRNSWIRRVLIATVVWAMSSKTLWDVTTNRDSPIAGVARPCYGKFLLILTTTMRHDDLLSHAGAGSTPHLPVSTALRFQID
jgi:hypothetical protein